MLRHGEDVETEANVPFVSALHEAVQDRVHVWGQATLIPIVIAGGVAWWMVLKKLGTQSLAPRTPGHAHRHVHRSIPHRHHPRPRRPHHPASPRESRDLALIREKYQHDRYAALPIPHLTA